MCGRFTLATQPSDLQAQFSFEAGGVNYAPSYNVAPTQEVLVVVHDKERRRGQLMRWGLIPSWAKDPSIGNRMINARAESLAEKPAFRNALLERRCLILADGFYEWRRLANRHIPYRIVLKSRRPFALAGLWEAWKDPSGRWLRSCTIVTTSANELMQPIHPRMPVMLPDEVIATWLDVGVQDVQTLTSLLKPYPSDLMEAYPVSTLVNSPANNGPEIITRIDPETGEMI